MSACKIYPAFKDAGFDILPPEKTFSTAVQHKVGALLLFPLAFLSFVGANAEC
jgi:hypothetical protein